MRLGLLSVAILAATYARVEAACIDTATLAHSTVSITRHFDDLDSQVKPGVLGIRGTAWFLSPTSIVTVEHVAIAMKLSERDWKEVEIREEETKQSIPARLQRIVGANAERIAIVELQTAFIGAQGFPLRMEPLVSEEPLVSLAYPGGRLRIVSGRFVQYGDSSGLMGAALLEMYDGDDRLVLDHGASGAPVVDCHGRVVAVVSNLFVRTMQFMARQIRISTAWGNPNVVSVPISALGAHE